MPPGAPAALNIKLLLTTCFRYLGNETSLPQQLVLRKEMKCSVRNRFRWWSYSFKRDINRSKQYRKTKGRKTHQQGVEETRSLASLAQPHHGQCFINLLTCWTGRQQSRIADHGREKGPFAKPPERYAEVLDTVSKAPRCWESLLCRCFDMLVLFGVKSKWEHIWKSR